jgi:hypothetical protein
LDICRINVEGQSITLKAFKNSSLKIAYSTNNTVGKLLAAKQLKSKCKYEQCGIYQITCPTCNMKYTGQTGGPFKTRFQEHFRDFKYANRKSSFAQHLLDKRHAMGHMTDIMDIIHITKKRENDGHPREILHISRDQAGQSNQC